MKVRALYGPEDLETQYLRPSGRDPDVIRLVQGKHQLVLGDHYETIHLANVLEPMANLAKVHLDALSVPILTGDAQWLRDDISVTRGEKQNGAVLFVMGRVSGPLEGFTSTPHPDSLGCPRTRSNGAPRDSAAAACTTFQRPTPCATAFAARGGST